MSTELGRKIVARADADGLPADHELRVKGAAFDKAAAGFYGEPQTYDAKAFFGHWARARKAWCDYTGDPLL